MENNKPFPGLYPDTGSVYSYGWQIMKRNFVPLLVVALIVIIAGSLPNITSHNYDYSNRITFSAGSLSFLISVLLTGPISFSGSFVFLKAVRGEPFDIKDTFSCFGPRYLDIMMAYLLTTIIIVAGIFLLIIPGIIFAIRLSFVPFLVTDKGLNATAAISASWKMTSGYSWQIFFMGIVAILIVFVGLLLFIIGIIPAIMLIMSAFAAMYHAVDSSPSRVIEV